MVNAIGLFGALSLICSDLAKQACSMTFNPMGCCPYHFLFALEAFIYRCLSPKQANTTLNCAFSWK
jgi:hypothetical protein